MSWEALLVIYMSISLLMSEGLLYHDRKAGQRTRPCHYLVAVLLGPIGLLIIVWKGLRGTLK